MPQAPVQSISSSGGMSPQLQAASLLPKILRIGVIQGWKIVEERLVRKRENLTVWQSTKSSLVIPTEALPKSFVLFELGAQGYGLHFTDHIDGRISLGDQVLALSQIKEQGRARR